MSQTIGAPQEREGKALTNFHRALPPPDSDLAEQILEDPSNFDFLTVSKKALEREIERGLLAHLQNFLLELGRGFSFVGSQVPLEVGGETFYIDLLFHHVRLHCYFVIELKTGKFKPEWAGKLSFFLSAVDGLFRTEPDMPTIVLLLCETCNTSVVEYALQNIAADWCLDLPGHERAADCHPEGVAKCRGPSRGRHKTSK